MNLVFYWITEANPVGSADMRPRLGDSQVEVANRGGISGTGVPR